MDRTRDDTCRPRTGFRPSSRAFVRTRIEYAEANRDFIKIYHSEFGNLTNAAAVRQRVPAALSSAGKDAARPYLQEAMEAAKSGAIRSDFAAFIIYDMVTGVMTQRLLEWSTVRDWKRTSSC